VAQTFRGISPTRYTDISNWQTILVSGFSTATFMASTFYTILYRRRWEIGLLKSMGFKSSFIIMMLLIEPFILGFVAGLTGFILAYLISVLSIGVNIPFLGYIPLLSSFIPQIEIKPIFLWGVLSIIVSILISIISSFLPAYTASRLTPIEAMRGNKN
jgi:putative ABC transport system permease protein